MNSRVALQEGKVTKNVATLFRSEMDDLLRGYPIPLGTQLDLP